MLKVHVFTFNCFHLVLLILEVFCWAGLCQKPMSMYSNFNIQKVSVLEHSPMKLQDPLSLPIVQANPGEYKSHRPLFQKYSLHKYQLYDTNYDPDVSQMTKLDIDLAFNMQPPLKAFQQSSKIVVQNYRLLEMKEFKITLINPSERFRFCVEELFIDSQEITRLEKRPLPFCLNSTTKYPFFFNLYITEHKPLIFKGTIYFIIAIYDGDKLVEQKIWPRQILVKVTHNHLRMIPLEIRNYNKENSIVMIRNPQKYDLSLQIIYKRKLYELTGEPIEGNIIIPSQKSYKFIIDGKDSKMTIYTKSTTGDITYPVLYVPIYCIQDLIVDYFNIGILSDDRSLIELPVTVSSYSNNSISIQEISLKSSTETVELVPLKQRQNYFQIESDAKHFLVSRIIIHSSKLKAQVQRSNFQVAIKYLIASGAKMDERKQEISEYKNEVEYEVRQTKTTFYYCQMRSPISVGMRRFLDISKLNDGATASVSQNSIPIRNNLNLPINLIRVNYDESKFKLLWLQDKRDFIYSNHHRDEFSLQYIGPRNLTISPIKYICLLQFNGNLLIPLEIVVYDKTLQCLYGQKDSKPLKCSDLPTIQFGYFDEQSKIKSKKQPVSQTKKTFKRQQTNHNNSEQTSLPKSQAKVRQIYIRNWNPQPKNIKVGIEQNSIQKYGFNTTIELIGPFPDYEVIIRKDENFKEIYLKGNHYVILKIKISPLANATSGILFLKILTPEEQLTKPIKFKVENATIALIPQVLRFQPFYKKSTEYLNLVSTYKQPYKIKSIESNLSNLIVYCNDYSEIYQNQWIGIALIYEPFLEKSNITEDCCSEKKAVETIFRDLKVGTSKHTPIEIKLKTSTELQVSALVLIDKFSPPLIELPHNPQFSFREKFRKDAQRIDINLIDDGNMQMFQYKLKVRNIFDATLKGNVMIFDEDFIQRIEKYADYREKMKSIVIAYFCIRSDVKAKQNFNPTLIKTLFQASQSPLQIGVEIFNSTSFSIHLPYLQTQQIFASSEFSQYFKNMILAGCDTCYRFQTSLFVKNMIQTGVVNWFSQQYRFETLYRFIRKQLEQLQSQTVTAEPKPGVVLLNKKQINLTLTKYNLHYEQFYASHYVDKQMFCWNQDLQEKMTSLFKFCQHTNIKMRYLDSQSQYEKKSFDDNDCLNATNNSEGKVEDQYCKKDPKSSTKKKKLVEQISDKYFLLPPSESVSKQNNQCKQDNSQNGTLRLNQMQLAFQIYPVKNRPSTFTISNARQRYIFQDIVFTNQQNAKYVKPQKNSQKLKGHERPLFLTNPSFYLVLLNNYTSYQLYHQTIQISKPKLRIKSVIINNELIDKNLFLKNYFREESENLKRLKETTNFKVSSELKAKKNFSYLEKSQWIPIYIEQKQIKVKKQQVIKSDEVQILRQQLYSPAQSSFNFDPEEERVNIKELLMNENIENIFIQGEKSFEITNEGQANISYTHIGFQNIQNTCFYKGIRIIAGPCTEDWKPSIKSETKKGQRIKTQKPSITHSTPRYSKAVSYKLILNSSSFIKVKYEIPLVDLLKAQNLLELQKKLQKRNQNSKIEAMSTRVYLYNDESYFIELIIKFKLSAQLELLLKSISEKKTLSVEGERFFLIKIWNISLNILAVVFICTTIFKFRKDEEWKGLSSKKMSIELAQLINSKYQGPSMSNTSTNYQKVEKKFKMRNELLNGPESGQKEIGQISYQIIEPSFYQFTIGTPMHQKNLNSYHPIATVSDDFLNSIKQEEKNESKILQSYFNESEESQILIKNQHSIHDNISLTINLEDPSENQALQNKQDASISEESSFEFQIRSTLKTIEIQKNNENQVNEQSISASGSDFSQASDSELPEGEDVEVTDEILNESDEHFGFDKKKLQTKNQERQDKKEGYYDIFRTQNPLKKSKQQLKDNYNPFSWMNENKKRSRLKW